jgi:hypothetical protein
MNEFYGHFATQSLNGWTGNFSFCYRVLRNGASGLEIGFWAGFRPDSTSGKLQHRPKSGPETV